MQRRRMSGQTILLWVSVMIVLWSMQSCDDRPPVKESPLDLFWSLETALEHALDVHALELSYQLVNGLPDTMRVFVNISTLTVRYCNIDTLPNWICELRDLDNLNLSHNRLAEFPPQAFCIKRLRVLKLGSNPITRIPDSLDRLENMWTYSLDSCRLTSLPPSFVKSKAHIVRLGGNQIEALPDSLFLMKGTLEYLNLSGNPIPQHEKDRILRELSPKVTVVF